MALAETIRLSDYLQHRTGNFVRGVLHYDDDGYVIEYAREDIFPNFTSEKLEYYVERLREANEESQHIQGELDYGRLKASAQIFDDIVSFHFTHEDGSGTVVAVDSKDMEELQDLIGSCLTVLHQRDV